MMLLRRHSLPLAWLPLAALLAALVGFAPTPSRAADYVIQPEDVLSIKVTGEPALSINYPVTEAGEITMDMVGKVKLVGLTVKQAEEKIATELKKFIKLFEVTIFVVGEGGGGSRALVYGEVMKPGSVKVKQDTRLLDVLAQAGQPLPSADTKRISLTRKGAKKAEIFDLDEVLKDPDLNVPILAGDTVSVPSKTTNAVSVTGEVSTPGPRALETARTAFEAVRGAGPTANADWARITLRRKSGTTLISLDLNKVRIGQAKDDFELQEGDVLNVPSRFAGVAIIRGEVEEPGEKDLNGVTYLWDLILKGGGGLTDRADRSRIKLRRLGAPERTVDLQAVASGRKAPDDPEYEVLPGDVIFVPVGVALLRGEVKAPGEKSIGSAGNIVDFILGPGEGFTDYADLSRVSVLRDGKAQTFDVRDYVSGLKNADDPLLAIQPGDQIRVTRDEKNRFIIVGGVNQPGSYKVKPGMTLLDAINSARSFSERATQKKFVVARAESFTEDGKVRGLEAEEEAAKAEAEAAAKKSEDGEKVTAGDKKQRDDKREEKSKKSRKKRGEDDAPSGMVVIDYKKLINGDPTQNVPIRAGDRILIPEENPRGGEKRSIWDSIIRLAPMAAGVGYY